MCGIFCLLSNNPEQNSRQELLNEFKQFEQSILRRGPNYLKTEYCELGNCNFLLATSVLWFQGTQITVQPLKTENSIFLYNGDVFGGSLISEDERRELGDTKLFFEALQNSDDFVGTLNNIEGPFAFIYLNIENNKLYFGRDIYGRRSLLIAKRLNQLIITSVAKRNTQFDFIEIPCTGVFCIDLNTQQWQLFPWRRKNKNFCDKINELVSFLKQDIKVDQTFFNPKSFTPPNEIQSKILDEILNLKTEDLSSFLSSPLYLNNAVKLKELLKTSIKKRVECQPKFCQSCYNQSNCTHAITGVLFSGGVDCAILALLSSDIIENARPIDLINVAFEKDATYETPDRITGISTFLELQKLRPERKWNFVEVNVTRDELNLYRSEHISHLIYPLKSILDDSLGCALWFASRAESSTYTSPCRTLLVGMGADELFGGYTRHRAAFQKKGWEGLHEVLEEDWQNLPHRNLARDDRVVSDHGRQLRTPYLDEEVVRFVQDLNCWDKTFPSNKLPQGIGEKILLRSLAFDLGLKGAAMFKKRALQFGSRIANNKEKGHETSEFLK